MGIAEAKKYIADLRKRQENPYLWPDFLTGLPEKPAIISNLQKIYPKLGEFAIAYIRIANIHPYLIKYGPDKHAEIIQWAAAILKTSCDLCQSCFVGTVSTHDFVVMCRAKNIEKHMKDAIKLFNNKVESYYVREDLNKGTILSFSREGEKIQVGLMKMVGVIVDARIDIDRSLLIREMARACDGIVSGEKDIMKLTKTSKVKAKA